MTLKVFTSQIRYSGPDRLDITIKSGELTFAPTWDMVMGYKSGKLTEEAYTKAYYSMMRASYRANRARWDELLSQPRVVLVCYCKAGAFCHRTLLANILVKLGASYGGEIVM